MRVNNSFRLKKPKISVEAANYNCYVLSFDEDEDGVGGNRMFIVLRDTELAALHFQIQTALLHKEMEDSTAR